MKSATALAFKGLAATKGYTCQRLAEALNVSPAVLSHRIAGRTPWAWGEVLACCKALEISPDEFARYYQK